MTFYRQSSHDEEKQVFKYIFFISFGVLISLSGCSSTENASKKANTEITLEKSEISTTSSQGQSRSTKSNTSEISVDDIDEDMERNLYQSYIYNAETVEPAYSDLVASLLFRKKLLNNSYALDDIIARLIGSINKRSFSTKEVSFTGERGKLTISFDRTGVVQTKPNGDELFLFPILGKIVFGSKMENKTTYYYDSNIDGKIDTINGPDIQKQVLNDGGFSSLAYFSTVGKFGKTSTNNIHIMHLHNVEVDTGKRKPSISVVFSDKYRLHIDVSKRGKRAHLYKYHEEINEADTFARIWPNETVKSFNFDSHIYFQRLNNYMHIFADDTYIYSFENFKYKAPPELAFISTDVNYEVSLTSLLSDIGPQYNVLNRRLNLIKDTYNNKRHEEMQREWRKREASKNLWTIGLSALLAYGTYKVAKAVIDTPTYYSNDFEDISEKKSEKTIQRIEKTSNTETYVCRFKCANGILADTNVDNYFSTVEVQASSEREAWNLSKEGARNICKTKGKGLAVHTFGVFFDTGGGIQCNSN